VGKVLAREAFRNSCQAFQHPRQCITNTSGSCVGKRVCGRSAACSLPWTV
jgi:hypothetical protein